MSNITVSPEAMPAHHKGEGIQFAGPSDRDQNRALQSARDGLLMMAGQVQGCVGVYSLRYCHSIYNLNDTPRHYYTAYGTAAVKDHDEHWH